jgi:hypothetical protein
MQQDHHGPRGEKKQGKAVHAQMLYCFQRVPSNQFFEEGLLSCFDWSAVILSLGPTVIEHDSLHQYHREP